VTQLPRHGDYVRHYCMPTPVVEPARA
jgi:hypothetical protein